MDPTTVFCPNTHCHARGQTGQGNIGIHLQQEQRFICRECHKTFSATTGTVFYRLRTGRNRGDGRDLARPRVSRASDRGGVWVWTSAPSRLGGLDRAVRGQTA